MKIVTWNVNSLKARQPYVEAFLDAVQPDVLAIQELKLATDKVPKEMFTDRGYHLAIHGQKQWNGVLLASKKEITEIHRGLPEGDEEQSRLVAATIDGIRFVNLYCPQGSEETSDKYIYKLKFFDRLLSWVDETSTPDQPLMLLGDINIAPHPHDVFWDVQEKPNIVTHHPLELERFQKLMEWGLFDLGESLLEPGDFTFFDYRSFWDFRARRYRYDLGLRIDHFLVTKPLVSRAQSMEVLRTWRHKKKGHKPSDHVPVVLNLS